MNEHTKTRKDTYSMTELRREFDVSARTLRFYEDKGLLHPARAGQNRIFSYRDRARLKLILRGKRVGFSLAEIREILDLYNLKDGQVTQLRVSLDKGRERITALEEQKRDIEEAIADLTRTCEIIQGMLKEREAEGRESGGDPAAP